MVSLDEDEDGMKMNRCTSGVVTRVEMDDEKMRSLMLHKR